ncbi:chromate efflux transporter [Paenirhodobacter hankyongi]|uniref:chromate efflux transporter n=1 Tax=Paenirhodobacter hankyongi TaxID=2294033 RepID=UPI001FEBF680|nr:chromate efflux transporter [Sinirhodobacter hankyongi]
MNQIFGAFLRLGLTSFGGPTAHIGYFRTEFVLRRGWLSEAEFAERLAIAQFLPGPASSQLGFAIGLHRGGVAGALAAFLGFTLPSALLMTLAGLSAQVLPGGAAAGAIAGLKLVALAVVAQALWGMARNLCPDTARRLLALVACAALLALPASALQIGVIALAAAIGVTRPLPATAPAPLAERGRALGPALALACLLLAALPFARPYLGAGALVFGGGHVVLPLLREALPDVGAETFLAGYGLAQAMPGPLCSFAAYLGAATGGIGGALIATAAIFAPGFALYAFILPLWSRIGASGRARGAVAAVNAAVVGVLAAAFLTQILPAGLHDGRAAGIAALLLALAFGTRLPPVALVGLGAGLGAALL